MSKPTDLDELIRLQEEEERRLREENLRAPIDPHDVTQEIDVDEALGYDTEEAVKNIDWPAPEQPLQGMYRARQKNGSQVARIVQARPGRSGKQEQEQNSPNLGLAY